MKVKEMDAVIPRDWRLEIRVMDKTTNVFSNDGLIGTTVVDLENRFYSNPQQRARRSLILELDKLKKDESALKSEKDKKKKEKLKKYYKERKSLIGKMMKKVALIEQVLIPVENRELYHPQKQQAQGVVETWIEVMTLEEARRIDT